MKKLLPLLLLTLLMIGCKSKSKVTTTKAPETETRVEKIDLADVDANQKKKAYELGTRVLMTCNTSRFKPFTTKEATASVIQNTTEARLTKTCLKFRLKYGDFKDMTLIEVLRPKNGKSTIYRYKAHYEKQIANKELRVTMDEENRISSLKSTDWVDKYKPL